MVCIYCGEDTEVINSRIQKRNNLVWRRRACKSCFAVITTLESPDLNASLLIQDPDGALEPFIKEKLYMSILFALPGHTRRYNDAAQLTNTIIGKLLTQSHGSAIPLESVTNCCLKTLKRFNAAAYLKYAAEYASGSVRILPRKKQTTS